MKAKHIIILAYGFCCFSLPSLTQAQDKFGYKIRTLTTNSTLESAAIMVDEKLSFLYDYVKTRINCHKLGTIVTFDPATQTATVRISYKVWEADLDPNYYKNWSRYGAGNTRRGKLIDYPLLNQIPVFIPAGGNASLTMPVKPGDPCLVIFSDLDIRDWVDEGKTIDNNPFIFGPVLPERSIRDALAIVGFRPMTNRIQNYNANDAELRNADARIVAGADGKVSIKNDKESLHGVLTELVEYLEEFTTENKPDTSNDKAGEKLKKIKSKLNALLKP